MGKRLKTNWTWKFSKKIYINFIKFKILYHFGVPENQILLHVGVPDNQIVLQFGVPDNQILLHLDVPNNCSGLLLRGEAKQEPGKRFHSSNWGTLGLPPQNEEHYFKVQCILYTVHLSLYTVHCTQYTVHCTLYTVHCTLYPHLSVIVARQSPVLLTSTSAEHGSRTTYPPSQV